MNYSYRSKPVVVQAFQMTEERRADNRDWPRWLHDAWNMKRTELGSCWPSEFPDSDGTDKLMVMSNSGSQLVQWGDYIVLGVDGLELYPVKEEVFLAKYEPVEDSNEQ